MPSLTIYERLFLRPIKGKGIFVLLDPDKLPREGLEGFIGRLTNKNGVKAVLVGTSLLLSPDFDDLVKQIREAAEVPVILFPGNSFQVSTHADAILFLSLISGRNPDLLIGEHVKAAPLIKRLQVESIPTAYILIQSEGLSSVEFMSNTKPIPRDKRDIAIAHALAAELLGFRILYLEAGSGALTPVPPPLIQAVREAIDLPIIVGGGIRDKKMLEETFQSGADYVVIGTALEENQEALEVLL